nr:hypothetical protein CFP56_23804 [Quercus suber]
MYWMNQALHLVGSCDNLGTAEGARSTKVRGLRNIHGCSLQLYPQLCPQFATHYPRRYAQDMQPPYYIHPQRSLGRDRPAAFTVITAITGLIWSLVVLCIRTYLRVFINGPFGRDDFACIIATIFACMSSTFTLLQVHHGLGTHIGSLDAHAQDMIRIMSYLNAIFFVLALAFSVLSICMLIERITSSTKQARISLGVSTAVSIWAVVSIFVLAFQCDMPAPWRQGQGSGLASMARHLNHTIGSRVRQCGGRTRPRVAIKYAHENENHRHGCILDTVAVHILIPPAPHPPAQSS